MSEGKLTEYTAYLECDKAEKTDYGKLYVRLTAESRLLSATFHLPFEAAEFIQFGKHYKVTITRAEEDE